MVKRIFAVILCGLMAHAVYGVENSSDPRFRKMLDRFDKNKDGKISRDEYPWRKSTFDKLDLNKDRFLTADELAKIRSMMRLNRINANLLADIQYATVDGKKMLLDIYMPKKKPDDQKKPVLLVWIHGGGWTKGSRKNVNPSFLALVEEGYAVASIDYQLLGVPGLPQIIKECKGAIRFLRANAERYGYNADKIGVGGSSAGGHLALMLGTSGGVKELEGDIGGNIDKSSSVQAVVDFFGPSDMVLQPRVKQMMGSKYLKAKAVQFSPVTYVDKKDPPLLIYHGTADPVVPIEQGRIIHKKYQEAGIESTKHEIPGGSHGFTPAQLPLKKAKDEMNQFFERHLKK